MTRFRLMVATCCTLMTAAIIGHASAACVKECKEVVCRKLAPGIDNTHKCRKYDPWNTSINTWAVTSDGTKEVNDNVTYKYYVCTDCTEECNNANAALNASCSDDDCTYQTDYNGRGDCQDGT